ncbi:MAG: phosphoribosylpyrophosphate synthetase [Ignavibacteriaceae bacterium]
MYNYDTLSEALNDLVKRGFTLDFNLKSVQKKFNSKSFNVVEVYRFEGMSSTDDESVLYVIETSDGMKGTLVDAYGTYADSVSVELIQKLKFNK